MGVHITGDTHVALYDSVTDTAFGPIFPSAEAAENFLHWSYDRPDPRTLTAGELQNLYAKWVDSQGWEFGLDDEALLP